MSEKKKYLIGLGNPTMGDDGIGVKAIEALEAERVPEDWEVIDGGSGGMKLLKYFEEADKIVFVDAAKMKSEPGTVRVIERKEIKLIYDVSILSLHSLALPHVVELAETLYQDKMPSIIIIAIEPESILFGDGLSPSVAKSLPKVLEEIYKCLENKIS